MNVVAIHLYGYVGAAVVTVIVEALVFVLLYGYMFMRSPDDRLSARGLVLTAGCWLLAAVIVMLVAGSLPEYIQSLVWVVGFVVMIKVFGIIEDAEWEHAVSILRRVTLRAGPES